MAGWRCRGKCFLMPPDTPRMEEHHAPESCYEECDCSDAEAIFNAVRKEDQEEKEGPDCCGEQAYHFHLG